MRRGGVSLIFALVLLWTWISPSSWGIQMLFGGAVGGFLVSSLQSEPECGRAQAFEFFMEVRGLTLWCLVLSIFVGLMIGKFYLLFRLIGGNSS